MDKKRTIWRVILLLFVFSLILWGSGYLEKIVSFIQSKIYCYFYSISNFVKEIKTYVLVTENLQTELDNWRKEALNLYKENLKLKLILENIKRRESSISWLEDLVNKNIKLVYADIIGRDPVKWNLEFKINKGYENKIKVGMPVLYKEQIVGKVVKVEKSYSIVRTIYDPSFLSGVVVLNTKDQGIIRGAYDHIELAYLFSDHGIKEGDIVITSGTDEEIPYGLRVGYITGLTEKTFLAFTKVKILPFINISNIEGVAVCLSF